MAPRETNSLRRAVINVMINHLNIATIRVNVDPAHQAPTNPPPNSRDQRIDATLERLRETNERLQREVVRLAHQHAESARPPQPPRSKIHNHSSNQPTRVASRNRSNDRRWSGLDDRVLREPSSTR